MIYSNQIEGLALKVGPLGESDRLLTLLSEEEGISRFAVPGARRPKSSLAGAIPMTVLKLHIVGKSSLKKVTQLKVIHSFNNLSGRLDTLSAAQAIIELSLILIANQDPISGYLSTTLLHLKRLEILSKDNSSDPTRILATCVQSFIHLLALGGYGLPIQTCCITGINLEPPIGDWEWKCTLIPDQGFAIGKIQEGIIQLNPSELALLQRLVRPNLPQSSNGKLMGPKEVWIKFLNILEYWINNHLSKKIKSLSFLKEHELP